MPEAYRVNLNQCTFQPPGANPPNRIDMRVTAVNNPPTPVGRIVAYSGSATSWEYETQQAANRYADIYFSSGQFSTLVNNINNRRTTYITYDAPAISGSDRISNQRVTTNYP